MKCPECKGSGEVQHQGYREMDQTNTTLQKSITSKRLTTFLCSDFAFGIGVIVVCALALVCISWIGEREHEAQVIADRKAAYENNKGGEVLVEYNATGHPIKCVVQHGQSYRTSNPTRSIFIRDRRDDLMVAEAANAMDWVWEEAKTKCIRFHYSYDDR